MTGRAWIWAFGGGVTLASAGLLVVACSSSPAPIDNPLPTLDGSKADTSNNTPDTSIVNPDGGTLDSAVACANPPKLFAPSTKGIYCPYSKGVDGGAQYCTVKTEVCCLSPSNDAGPSTCAANANACPQADAVWACSAPEECNVANPVCCLTAGPLEADPNCAGFQRTKGFNNTRCTTAQACAGTIDAGKFIDNQFVACTKQADCATGTCTPIKTSGTSFGVCL
jgi:hypothetical protein